VISLEDVSVGYGSVAVQSRVSARVGEGEIFAIVGDSGSGKSTLLRSMIGLMPPQSGRVVFEGAPSFGVLFQNGALWSSMSVLENVAVGAVFGRAHGNLDHAERCLELVGLGARGNSLMASLNLQERKNVELARALAMAPRVVLIDEAMSGLNPAEIEQSMRLIRRVRDQTGVTIIWVEHVVKAIMAVVERILVLNFGQIIAAGTPAEIAADPAVIEAYLGTAA